MKELAQELYEAYCEHTGWKSAVTGAALPPWPEVGRAVQDAWRAVAGYVERREAVLREGQ